jgi:XTP/dITP diphosphohydrolase
VLVLVRPGGREVVASGTTEGRIAPMARGRGGFGYDPLFISDELGVSFGEASAEAKHSVSHRGRAIGALMATAGSWLDDRHLAAD